MGLTRETSARFSFLMSTPIIAGAGLKTLMDVSPRDISTSFITGVVVSAIIGFLAITYLLKYLTNHSYSIFVWYRLVFGLLIIGVYFLR